MHFYMATVGKFIDDAQNGRIAPWLRQSHLRSEGHEAGREQLTAWEKSSTALAQALDTDALQHVEIFLELRMPLCNRRCDALLVGQGTDGLARAVVVELKQWGHISRAVGATQVVHHQATDLHPCQQAQGYENLLRHFHSAFTQRGMKIQACAYLHNLSHVPSINVLRDPVAFGHLPVETPLFIQGEEDRLREYLTQAVGGAQVPELRDWIVHGIPEPSPKLMDRVAATIQGKAEWTLIDEQRLAFDTILTAVNESRATGKKSIIIVRGGPGTGKSVLAIQLLGHAAKHHWKVVHATGSKAFQTVLRAQTEAFSLEFLKKNFNVKTKNRLPVEHLFSTFAQVAATGVETPEFVDLLVGDEAHRLWDFRRGTRFQKFKPLSDVPMIQELIASTKVTALFLDDNQAVRASEIGRSQYIVEAARNLGIEPVIVDLNAQFRCNGSASYVEWVDHVLGFSDQSNLAWYEPTEDQPEYEFRIFDSPAQMQEALRRRRTQGFKARIVAGFCWPWSEPLPSGLLENDIQDPRFGGWSMPWIEKTGIDVAPLQNQYYLWANEPTDEYFQQSGSIYSVQGFEFDYVAVIVGEDLVWTGQRWQADLKKSADGAFKANVRDDPEDATEKLRSVYRVLLTRGMRGTYVYFLNQTTREHFERMLHASRHTRDAAPVLQRVGPRAEGTASLAVQASRPKRDSVFISYSRKDKRWLEQLTTHLAPLVRDHGLKVWDDTRIQAGAEWRAEIQEALASAKVAVMLVSAHFLASEFIARHELPPLLSAAQKEGLKILWVPLSDCLVDKTDISRYQSALGHARPLSQLSTAKVQEAWVKVCREIEQALNQST